MEESLHFQILCEYYGFDELLTSEAFFYLNFLCTFLRFWLNCSIGLYFLGL